MFEDLVHKAKLDSKLFVELLVNFYLDANVVERQQIEQIILNFATEKNIEQQGEELVFTLRDIVTSKGLQSSKLHKRNKDV
ncbi:MAG: hypothetical protein HXY43_25990 [Fischerella sp.]|jgi:hypothetical protein|uniref:hypothetical protein n=1 Tax=Fischerella sp. TaxID=1191 RepID=UPI0017CA5118|nr:hypothetical protein [Fischerella sp.]NWF62590.1 hypothetical protein [Fischerella sp.]